MRRDFNVRERKKDKERDMQKPPSKIIAQKQFER